MATEITDLLRYKEKVELTSPAGKKIGEVWVRVLGDYDLQLAYRLSRIASTKKRSLLRTPGSTDYMDEIQPIPENNSREDCIALIKAAKVNIFTGEAYANVNKEEPPKLEEVAEEPDAPTLEEQEKMDLLQAKINLDYANKINEYIEDRTAVLMGELELKTDEEIYDMTKYEMSNLLAMQEFQRELTNQKIFRAVYKDQACKVRAFAEMDEFSNSHPVVKEQLISAYTKIELTPDDVKN